ncbi:MAG: Hpt domain-containing protein [Clostridia bacterium]|nr:Hpt domain-containing protein [Clostridia bacterium]
MLTLETLAEYGANVKDGLSRCMEKEEMYLKLVGMAIEDTTFGELEKAMKNGDTEAAFMSAHKLKGMLANLSLDPILRPVSELTEYLRGGSAEDHSDLLEEICMQHERLEKLSSQS